MSSFTDIHPATLHPEVTMLSKSPMNFSASATRPLASLALAALAVTCLPGCLTRQVWAPSYAPDATHAVEVKEVGHYVPEQEVARGAGGTAWRAAVTPLTVVADGAVTFVLFFADLAGLSYGAGDWTTRVPAREGVSSPTAAEFPNLPSWFLTYVNRPLKDDSGRELTFLAMPKDRQVYVSGLVNQTQMLTVSEHTYQGKPIQLSAFSAAIPSAGESSAVVTLVLNPVDSGLEIEGSYRGMRDGAREAKPITKAIFRPSKP